MRLLKHVIDVAQNYYPETLGNVIVCNAPMLFTGIWAAIKGWIDEKTRKKVAIVGGSYLKKI